MSKKNNNPNLTVFSMPGGYAYLVGNANLLIQIGMRYPSTVQHFCTSERVLCICDYNKCTLELLAANIFRGKLKLHYSEYIPEEIKSIHERKVKSRIRPDSQFTRR